MIENEIPEAIERINGSCLSALPSGLDGSHARVISDDETGCI
jgi:hypothetical protein